MLFTLRKLEFIIKTGELHLFHTIYDHKEKYKQVTVYVASAIVKLLMISSTVLQNGSNKLNIH